MPIFRRTNCIFTAYGNVALCKRLHSTPVESGLGGSALNRCTVQPPKRARIPDAVKMVLLPFGTKESE